MNVVIELGGRGQRHHLADVGQNERIELSDDLTAKLRTLGAVLSYDGDTVYLSLRTSGGAPEDCHLTDKHYKRTMRYRRRRGLEP
jgi:hypothetical protein